MRAEAFNPAGAQQQVVAEAGNSTGRTRTELADGGGEGERALKYWRCPATDMVAEPKSINGKAGGPGGVFFGAFFSSFRGPPTTRGGGRCDYPSRWQLPAARAYLIRGTRIAAFGIFTTPCMYLRYLVIRLESRAFAWCQSTEHPEWRCRLSTFSARWLLYGVRSIRSTPYTSGDCTP